MDRADRSGRRRRASLHLCDLDGAALRAREGDGLRHAHVVDAILERGELDGRAVADRVDEVLPDAPLAAGTVVRFQRLRTLAAGRDGHEVTGAPGERALRPVPRQ